jgi:UDP-N-acetylmuramate dehydrogenase
MNLPRQQKAERFISQFQQKFGDNFYLDHPLAGYTTFKIGGPARYFVECHQREDIIAAVNLAHGLEMDYFIIGGGSNLLISDQGYPGLIIHIAVNGLEVEDTSVIVDAGYGWEYLVDFCCRQGLAGMESMAGIKGTVGGAVYGNAGAFGTSVADILARTELLSPGSEPRWEQNKYFAFSYRNSILKRTKEIVLRVRFDLVKDSPRGLLSKQDEILALRSQKHPCEDRSAGCFFKNIEKPGEPYGKLAAGALLEKVGAKEMQIGGAKVSEKHANILLNSGKASAADIKRLADILKEKVKSEFGYILEEEITFLGDY